MLNARGDTMGKGYNFTNHNSDTLHLGCEDERFNLSYSLSHPMYSKIMLIDSLATSDCSLKKYILKEAPPISKFPNDPLLASILNPVPKTFRPIWEVDLQLQDHKPQTGRPCGKGKKKNKTKDSGRDSLKVTVKPSLQSLQEAVDSLLSLYHRVITSFVPISKDTRIAGYTTAARFDFLTRLAEENVEKPEVIIESEWPNLASLLLDFTPYEESVLFIRNVIGETMKTVESHSKVGGVMEESEMGRESGGGGGREGGKEEIGWVELVM